MIGSNDYRVQVNMKGCAPHDAPMTPGSVDAHVVADPKHSHQWGTLHFVAPVSAASVNHFEVRYSTQPIVAGDDASFNAALPALAAKLDSEALMVPTNQTAGSAVDVDFGGMNPSTVYWVAIRAVDVCNVPGSFAVAKLTTTKINFTKLAGCFIATAAYGSALEPQVDALRKVRDTMRPKSAVFATATDLYYRAGPAAAAIVSRSDVARAVVRSLLAPVVDVARAWPGTH